MNFSRGCADYIAVHSCAEDKERGVLCLIKGALPIGSSAIDWSRVSRREEVSDVDRASLGAKLTNIAKAVGADLGDVFYIINIDDAFPALKTTLSEWLKFIYELDFVDTIFVSESKAVVIHWDFHKNLHATKLMNSSGASH